MIPTEQALLGVKQILLHLLPITSQIFLAVETLNEDPATSRSSVLNTLFSAIQKPLFGFLYLAFKRSPLESPQVPFPSVKTNKQLFFVSFEKSELHFEDC